METNREGAWPATHVVATWPSSTLAPYTPPAVDVGRRVSPVSMGEDVPDTAVGARANDRETHRARDVAARFDRALQLEQERRVAIARLEHADARSRVWERGRASLTGGFVFFVAIAAFPAPSTYLMVNVTLVGLVVGLVAHALGDRPWSWALASLAASAVIAPLVSGPLTVLLVAVLTMGGWATGHFRNSRWTADAPDRADD